MVTGGRARPLALAIVERLTDERLAQEQKPSIYYGASSMTPIQQAREQLVTKIRMWTATTQDVDALIRVCSPQQVEKKEDTGLCRVAPPEPEETFEEEFLNRRHKVRPLPASSLANAYSGTLDAGDIQPRNSEVADVDQPRPQETNARRVVEQFVYGQLLHLVDAKKPGLIKALVREFGIKLDALLDAKDQELLRRERELKALINEMRE